MNEQIDFWGYFAKREEAEASADLMRRSGIQAEVVGQAGNWRVNYTVQPESTTPTERETLAVGWLSAELATRADAWAGNAPEWFPEPPEWLDLWAKALAATNGCRS